MYDNNANFIDFRLKDNFNEYISSLLYYKYTTKFSDLQTVGNKIMKRYFPDGNFDNSLDAVDVCIFVLVNLFK